MTVSISAPEVLALADLLRNSSGDAEQIGARLDGAPQVGGSLEPAVEAFLECHRTAGRALAGELQWLGATFAAVAGSWTDLDAHLLAHRGRATAE